MSVRTVALAAAMLALAPLAAGRAVAQDEPAASAKAEPDYARTGPYASLGFSLGIPAFEDALTSQLQEGVDTAIAEGILPADSTVVVNSISTAYGYNIRAGYRAHAYVGAEAAFEWFTPFFVGIKDITANDPSRKVSDIDVSHWMFSGNLKGYVLRGRFQPFVLVGIGVAGLTVKHSEGFLSTETAEIVDPDNLAEVKGKNIQILDENAKDFAARFGLGFDFYLSERVAITVDGTYVLTTGTLDDYDFSSVTTGIQYRF